MFSGELRQVAALDVAVRRVYLEYLQTSFSVLCNSRRIKIYTRAAKSMEDQKRGGGSVSERECQSLISQRAGKEKKEAKMTTGEKECKWSCVWSHKQWQSLTHTCVWSSVGVHAYIRSYEHGIWSHEHGIMCMDIYRAVMMGSLRVDVGWRMNWVGEVGARQDEKKSYFNKCVWFTVYVKVYLYIFIKRSYNLKAHCNMLPWKGNWCYHSMLTVVWHLPHLWCHLPCVLTENIHNASLSDRAGGDEEHFSLIVSALWSPGAWWGRGEGAGRSQREPRTVAVTQGFPLAWAGRGHGEAFSPPGEHGKTGPSLGSPKRKVQWWSTEWETRNGLNAGQMVLSLLIPKWHFTSPEFEILLPFSMPNIVLGNIIKSQRGEEVARSKKCQ